MVGVAIMVGFLAACSLGAAYSLPTWQFAIAATVIVGGLVVVAATFAR